MSNARLNDMYKLATKPLFVPPVVSCKKLARIPSKFILCFWTFVDKVI